MRMHRDTGADTRKLISVEQKMATLDAMRQALADLLRQCDADDGAVACPIIEVLAED